MKVLITYYSETGNTKEIARAIYQETVSQGQEAHLKPVDETRPEDLDLYDLVFVGSACHHADLAAPAKRMLEGIAPWPSFKLAGFATHATYTPEGGERQRALYERWAGRCPETFARVCQEKEIAYLGYFGCQGAASPAIEVFIHHEILPDEAEWAAYAPEMREHPNAVDLAKARAFARAVIEQAGPSSA